VMDILTESLQQVLVTILLGVLSIGAGYLVAWLRRAERHLKDQTDVEIAERMLSRAADVVVTVVWKLEGTVAKELRKAVKEGKASADELRAVGDRAVEEVLELLGLEARLLLDDTVDDLDGYIRSLIEAQLERMKKGAGDINGSSEIKSQISKLASPKAQASS
jgi:hypothetical protein